MESPRPSDVVRKGIPFQPSYGKKMILESIQRINILKLLPRKQGKFEQKTLKIASNNYIWVKVFKDGPSKICGRQPLKILNWYICLGKPYHFNFLKAVSHKFYLVYSWITRHPYVPPLLCQWNFEYSQLNLSQDYLTFQ